MDGSIYIRTDRTEKAHDLQVAILDGSCKRRPPMNLGVDVERRLVGLVYYSFDFLQLTVITSRVAL